MIARFDGKCRRCGVVIKKGQECEYQPSTKTIGHMQCDPDSLEDGMQAKDGTAEKLAESLGFTGFDKNGDLL